MLQAYVLAYFHTLDAASIRCDSPFTRSPELSDHHTRLHPATQHDYLLYKHSTLRVRDIRTACRVQRACLRNRRFELRFRSGSRHDKRLQYLHNRVQLASLCRAADLINQA